MAGFAKGNLSNTQAAFRFFNDRFTAGMEQRARHLWTDGYRVAVLDDDETGAALPTKFLVYKEGQEEMPAAESAYTVDALGETCTCAFFTNQAAEPLNESGEPVACKHLLGLRTLVDEEVAYWTMKADHTADYRREVEYARIIRGLTETLQRVGK